MGISRRGFLQAILAAAVAPAVVRAANLMKVVPISDTGIVGIEQSIFTGFDEGDSTIEMWAKQGSKSPDGMNWTDDSKWHHVAQIVSGSEVKFYLDGKQVARELMGPYQNLITHHDGKTFVGPTQMKPFDGYIGDVKVNRAAPDRMIAPEPTASSRAFNITGAQQVGVTSNMGFNTPEFKIPAINIPDPVAVATRQLGRLQQAMVGRALADVAQANNKVGQLLDQWDRPLITTPFDKLENKS